MLTSSRSLSSEMTNVPPVVTSSSQSVSSKKTSHRVPVQIFEGHEDWVRCVRFCPDEDKLVTGSDDDTLRIWNRTTGAVEVLRGHSGLVWDVDVSRDGKMIVSGSRDKTFRIWNRESGETMHVCEGHEDRVMSVQFSPDSSRVVSGSWDSTVRVWLIESGELAFEPIECHGYVSCVRHSPSGDRIASGADSVQIWNAETGSGIVSLRNSSVLSVAWTTDGTHIIGGREGEVTIWNSHTGEQLRTWKAHDDPFNGLSLSPSGSHLATCSLWGDKTAFVFDISTGEQIAVLKHNDNVEGIAYSPSGKFIATGCQDSKVYLWEAPVVEDPPAKSSAPPLPSLLDRPAVPLAGPSRNNRRELDAFWDTLPNRNQQAPPQREPQRVLDKVRKTFMNIFTRTPAGATQAISQSPVRETVEPVQVAAGRDKVFWVVVLIPTYNAVEKFLYTLIHCRKPEDPDEEVPAATGTNSSQTAADNTASSKQSGHPETGDGTENAPTLASNLIISTQPQRTAAMRLSGESLSAEHYRSETPVGDSQVYNQPESIEMVGIRETLTVSAHASPQPTPSAEPLSSAIPSCEPSSSVPNVTSAPLIVSSPEERALIQEYRRHKDKSVVLSGPAPRDRDSYIHLEPSTSLPPSSGSVTPSTSSAPFLVSPQAHSHIHAGPSPILHTTPALLSPSPLSAVSRHSHSLHQPSTTSDVQSLDQTAQCVDNIVVEARDSINTGSLASPAADEADRQHLILHLQDQVEQCRRQLDDAVAAMRKAESERDGLATGSAGSGLSFMQDGPPRGSELITDSQSDPSAFSNVLYQGHPSGSAQSISGSIEAEEQANEKKEENTLSDPTNKAIDSQRSVHPPHHHGPTRPTMVSPAPTAADMANVQRVLLRLQQQVEQLRQRVDDPMWKVAAEGDGLDTGSPAVEAGPLLRN